VQIIQILGALAILAAFGLAQRRLLANDSYVYLFLNLAGSAALAVTALDLAQWGFVLLNTSWFIVALFGLMTRLRRQPRAV
jgi:hypothetical protein